MTVLNDVIVVYQNLGRDACERHMKLKSEHQLKLLLKEADGVLEKISVAKKMLDASPDEFSGQYVEAALMSLPVAVRKSLLKE